MMKPPHHHRRSHREALADNGPSAEDHGRVLTTNRRAAAFYRQAQRAVDARQATTALHLAVSADPTFGLAVADLDAIAGTAGDGSSRHQMNWERHHIEVVRTAASGNARRATDLLREHLASVGCDPLAVRIVAQRQPPGPPREDFEDLVRRLPGCHGTPVDLILAWARSSALDRRQIAGGCADPRVSRCRPDDDAGSTE